MTTTDSLGQAIVAVNGEHVNLVPLVGTTDSLEPQWRARLTPADQCRDLCLGEIAFTRAFGEFRRGVITKIGRKNVTVSLTTPGTVDKANRGGFGITVYAPSRPAQTVYVFRPAGGAL